MKTASIQNKNIETLVRKNVISVFREIFTDPEYRLKLKPNFVKRLKKSLESKNKGGVHKLDNILKKYRI
ncbi:hypothetical protein KJ763_00885 [Patescibacteria group bacterium]|nr:hypothetical protein [Patescibacteria group bacterium]